MPSSSQDARRRRPRPARRHGLRLLLLVLALGGTAWLVLPRPAHPLHLDYEVDLQGARQGRLTVLLRLEGDLPAPLALAFPARPDPGYEMAAVTLLSAGHPGPDGDPGRPVAPERSGQGWILHPLGASVLEVAYQVELTAASSLEEDIRRHVNVVDSSGFRISGAQLFAVPAAGEVATVRVQFVGGWDGRLAVPWPVEPSPRDAAGVSAPDYLPAASPGGAASGGETSRLDLAGLAPPDTVQPAPLAPVYRPQDLRDLWNGFVAWGDLRVSEVPVAGCPVRLAVSGDWLFGDDDLGWLLSRIARAELEFFGSAPQPSILCLVATNPVDAAEGFDYYGVHAGHSLLLFLDSRTSWAELGEKAASVAAHEMFHGWLGEAIQQEDPSLIWFVEGVTTWCTPRMLEAAGIWTRARSEEVLGGRIERDYFGSELLGKVSLAAAAAEVMVDGVTTRFAYAGGSLAAAALDAWLAGTTGSRHPLDDVMRHLYAHREEGPLTRPALEAAVRAVGGGDCAPWLDAYVYGKETLPRLDSLF
jgi:predicted metalloprotease with PDZ domain